MCSNSSSCLVPTDSKSEVTPTRGRDMFNLSDFVKAPSISWNITALPRLDDVGAWNTLCFAWQEICSGKELKDLQVLCN